MARPLRIEYPGAFYHVTARGNAREDIYHTVGDRHIFLATLSKVCERFNWVCHAYCLMTNHYHLVVETPEANLSKGMRQLNGVYTQKFNWRHHREGHLFQGRYKAIVVDQHRYLLELSRYLVLNPVKAGLVKRAEQWPWSSYRAAIGVEAVPPWLEIDLLLAQFSLQRKTAIKKYKEFVATEQQEDLAHEIKNQLYLGDAPFVESVRKKLHINGSNALNDVPKCQTRPVAKPLAHYLNQYDERDRAMAAAYTSGAYSMKQIGDFFGVHYMTVSRAVKKAEQKMGSGLTPHI